MPIMPAYFAIMFLSSIDKLYLTMTKRKISVKTADLRKMFSPAKTYALMFKWRSTFTKPVRIIKPISKNA